MMVNISNQNKKFPQLLLFLVIIIFIIGVFFRFVNIDKKVYSADEVRKIIWLSGYSSEEFIAETFTGQIITAKELKKYQYPNDKKSFIDSLKVLFAKIEHVPLHHVVTRFWLQIFHSNYAPKVITALIGIFALPCLYWLCLELFQSPITGLVAIAIVSVSPMHILAAQNAGAYTIWILVILLSSASLLRALRIKSVNSWLIYALSLAISFYGHLFSFMVSFGQAFYIFATEKFKITKNVIDYLWASILGLIGFSPWIVVFFLNINRIEKGTSYYNQFPASFTDVIMRLYKNIGKSFIDFYHNKSKTESLLHFCLFLLIVYSLYFLIKNTKFNTWFFIITLIIVTPLIHIIANFITPSALHLQFRYFLPTYIGIQLSIAYFLASQIIVIPASKIWWHRFWQFIFAILITLGILSGIFISKSPTAAIDDQKGTASGKNVEIANTLNKSANPLVITETNHSFLLALLYRINDNVNFQLLKRDDIQNWENNLNLEKDYSQFSDVYLLYPNGQLLDLIKKDPQIQTKSVEEGLLKVQISPDNQKNE